MYSKLSEPTHVTNSSTLIHFAPAAGYRPLNRLNAHHLDRLRRFSSSAPLIGDWASDITMMRATPESTDPYACGMPGLLRGIERYYVKLDRSSEALVASVVLTTANLQGFAEEP